MDQSSPVKLLYESIESEELRGFSRSIAELQWLLLILVLLYYFIPTGPLDDRDGLIVAMVGYTGFVLLYRYFSFRTRETRLKLAIETWAMIGFITVALIHTGYTESPLLNLYLLVIIACAITLGKRMTLLEVLLITCCYLLLGYTHHSVDIFSPVTFSALMARFTPFLLVAYVTSLLAADIILAKRKITELSQTDELTGLLNLRAFNLMLDGERTRARRYRAPFIVLMIDVDGLKAINDRHGHVAGSQLIRAVADVLRQSVRENDIVARYGGDEFVILMRQTDSRFATHCAERIRTAVSNTSFDFNGHRIAATASIGIAGFPGTVSEPDQVLDKADLALYHSKQEGRNQVTWYERTLETLSSVPLSRSAQTARQYA